MTINIVLPAATLRTLDLLAGPGRRSRFIQRAVEYYIAATVPESLKERLERAALGERDRDLEIAEEWASVEERVKAAGSDALRCSFCRKSQERVHKLISSPSDYPRAYICDECIAVCNSILEDAADGPKAV